MRIQVAWSRTDRQSNQQSHFRARLTFELLYTAFIAAAITNPRGTLIALACLGVLVCGRALWRTRGRA